MSGVVERLVEQRGVADFLGEATRGVSGLILEGDPGVGKTTLWLDALQQARDGGFEVLSARAGAAEVALTFAALADLLDRIDPMVLADLPSAQRLALNRVLDRTEEAPATNEHLIAAAFLNVLKRLAAEQPVLLAVDDIQWVDVASRTVLGFAVRRMTGRIGVLGTVRLDPAHAVAQGWLQLAAPDAVKRARVTPLTPSGLHALLLARTGRSLSRPALMRIAQTSGGNPFYALELARFVDRRPGPEVSLPTTLSAVVEDRIGRLGRDVDDVLLTVSAAAAPTVAIIAVACGLTNRQVVTGLEEAETHGVIALDGNRIRFTHPLLSAGVYGSASATRRRAVHAALAVAEDQLEVRARHLALAAVEGDPATRAALDVASAAALARGAPAAAAELVELSISLGGDSQESRLRHAELLFRAGAVHEARGRLAPLIESMCPGSLRARALSLLGAVLVYSDNFPEAAEVLTRALRDARGDAMLTLLTLLRLAPTTGLTGDRDMSLAYARRAVACADAIGIDAARSRALALWVNVSMLYGLGLDETALATALPLEGPGGDDHLTFSPSAIEAVTLAWRGRPDQARERFRLLAQRCEDRGAEAAAIWVAEHATLVDVWLGRYRDATDTAVAAQARAEQIGGQHVTVIAAALCAITAAYAGDVPRARAAANQAVVGAETSGGAHLAILPRTTLGFLEVSLGDYPAALAALAPLLARFDPAHGTEIIMGGFLPDAIEALVATGRLQEAEPLVAALEGNGTRLDRRWMRAVGARGRAILLAARGDLANAILAADRAMAEHERLPMPFERARTQLLVGQLQRRTRRTGAAATLSAATCTFQDLGAALWVARANTEMARVTATQAKRSVLTPSQQQIAKLAASGMINRDIAATVFLSVKTVEGNLSRIYEKLGIRSRAELGRRLDEIRAQQDLDPH